MSEADRSPVRVEYRDRQAWIILDRPNRLNALTPEAVASLDAALDEISTRDTVRSVALTGAGRAFCAGVDLSFARQAVQDRRLPSFLSDLQRVLTKLERLPVPVVAVVNGVTVGGGLELVLCCDLVVAATSATIGDGHANYGLIPGAGASFRLQRKIGLSRATWMIMTGALLHAEQLERTGLVHECVEPQQLTSHATELLDELADRSPLAMRETKRLLLEAASERDSIAGAAEIAAFARYIHSQDILEGIDAFADKRAPQFEAR